ncbi:hypothetical protein [Blastochloris tepida]|uniref:Uncharacterized protein n=1 Tax=Blastochloris tepida TaxID=2233851 RepID=A0A348G4H3_9HYPH|nr:hypothetical protein [Blastochloris tepida]BBF94456.1 hypothetical protein BLTE_31410 [Blastochloris tepida]
MTFRSMTLQSTASRSNPSRGKPPRFEPSRAAPTGRAPRQAASQPSHRRRAAALVAAAGLPVALGVAIMLLAPGWSAQTGASSGAGPTQAASAPVPLLFGGALAAVRPDIVRLPPTAADLFAPPNPASSNSASPGSASGWTPAEAPEVTGSLLRPGAGLAVRAAAHATGAAPAAAPSRPEPVSLPVARLEVAAAELPATDPRPVGLASTPPLAGLDKADPVTRGAPGDPGTFPPLVMVQHLLFTVDAAALPQLPFDHLAPLPATAGRSGRPHG